MSLYGSSFGSERSSQPGSRSTRTAYTSLAPSKATPASKLFELSMDDFDDIDKMGDMEHMSFGNPSQPTESRQRAAATNGRDSAALLGRRTARSHSYDQQPFKVTPNTPDTGGMLGRFDSGGSHSTLLSPEHRSGSTLELSQESDYMTKYQTPASYRPTQQQSSDSTVRVKFDIEAQSEHEADAVPSRASRGSAGYLAEPQMANEYALAETPAFKPPLHPAQGSTVTTRWKRRGRLGLAKPKRNDPGLPSDEITNDGNTNYGEGDSMGFGPSSPPKYLELLGGSSSSIDHKPLSSRHAQSPPRSSYLSGSEAGQRHSFVSMDEPAAEFENTFHSARPRYSSKSPPDLPSSGGPPDAARMPYESSIQNRSMDISDVSMTSNPRSRPHSPDPDSAAKTPASAGSLSRTSLNEHSGSSGKRTAERRHAEGGDAKEYAPSDVARHRALSPFLGRPRPLGSSVGSASNESLGQRAELAASPKMQHKRDSPRSQGQAMVRASTASSLEKRSSTHGDSAMEISSRFQQYEQRMKDASPQYRSPHERQRHVGGLVRSADVSMGSADSGREEDGEHNRLDQYAPPEPKSSSRRLNSTSSSARVSDLSAAPAHEGRPEHHSANSASPRLSARRVAVAPADNNFEALRRGSTPAVADKHAPNGVHGSVKATSVQSEDRNRSPYLSPVVAEKPALQAQYTEALSQVAQQRQQQQQPVAANSQPVLTPLQQTTQQQAHTNSQHKVAPLTTPQDHHHQQQQQQQQKQQQAGQSGMTMDPKRTLIVNGRSYQKISITGRGGSSKVYKAMSPKHEIFAIKR
ncbi:hypothetical protein GGF42_007592, partial [Coemansia sp. RSA 2424]